MHHEAAGLQRNGAASLYRSVSAFALVMLISILSQTTTVCAQDERHVPCTEDVVLVFDASGSMSGNGWGYGSESAHTVSRIDRVRSALEKVLPNVTRFRRVGLVTYGPTRTSGLPNQCNNIEASLAPTADADEQILTIVRGLVPAGGTPLTRAVEEAAYLLDYRNNPGVIVVLTDGEDTCGGSPCDVGKALHADAEQLTVHVISLRVRGLSWTGEASIVQTRCLAEQNAGLYLSPESTEELVEALEKTLSCLNVSSVSSRNGFTANH